MRTDRLRSWMAAVGLSLLAGCATHGGMGHHQGSMDMASMCAMHKQMMAGKTAAEQQAMMQDHMKSPQMRQHWEMMQQCK